tara:strand:+ start:846 stop:1127 length:282 start_codon:yes stop_codon:yes gene_type:complete
MDKINKYTKNAFEFHNYLLIHHYNKFPKIIYEHNSHNLRVINKNNIMISISFMNDYGIETCFIEDNKVIDDSIIFHSYDFEKVVDNIVNITSE